MIEPGTGPVGEGETPRPPTIGLFGVNLAAAADRVGAVRAARLAEALGYDSLWAGDHVVLPRPRVEPSPMEPDDPVLDPVVGLAFLAAHTERIRLATGVLVLPQRNPVVLAKQVASLDVLSGGRVILGVAVGYLKPELRAVGVPPADRGSRLEEYLAAMRSLWADDEPGFRGRYVDFGGVDSHPRPAQRPVPVVMGGHSAVAHRRAAALADGWYGWMLGLRTTAEQVAGLRRAVDRTRRPLHVSVSPARRLNPDLVRDFARMGVDRLVVAPPTGLALPELESFIEANAPDALGASPAVP